MRCGALVLLTLLLSACAQPMQAAPPADTDVLRIVTPPSPAVADGRRLWFLGLAMQSEQWSENDVADLYKAMRRSVSRYEVRPSPGLFSDRFPPGPVKFPPATAREIEPEIASVARSIKDGDVVVVYVSTHGAPGLLGRELDGDEADPVGAAEFQQWLAPLRGHDTVVILSACFSGSLIPALADPHRIIITAARADRTSFGCQAGAEHTVFGEALLGAIHPDTSLHTIVDRTRKAVTRQEHIIGVPAPSLPQVSVGPAVKRLYDAPVF